MAAGVSQEIAGLVVSDLLVRAAGGVLIQKVAGTKCVLVVHRPHYDDWSLPKGKADGDESDERTAIREVHEETGHECALGDPITTSHYVDRKGRPKRVRWYRMESIKDHGFAANEEIDEIRWVPFAEVNALLSYEREREVLAHLEESTP